MKIEYALVRDLQPYSNNARTHSRKQIRQIAKSIQKFGFCNPILIDDAKQIVAGHGRVEAAKLLGIDAVPTCRLSHLSEADKRAMSPGRTRSWPGTASWSPANSMARRPDEALAGLGLAER